MTDQTQTTTEPVAWRIRPKGALGDVMGFQIVTDKYVAQDYSEQPAFEVQPLYTTPQPLAIGQDREALERMVTFAEKLCMAADHYGVKHLDSDDMDDEAVELEAATLCMRHVIADAILALAAPAEGDADVASALLWFGSQHNLELSYGYEVDGEGGDGWQVHRVSGGRNDREWTRLSFGHDTPIKAIVACLPAAPTEETGA